MFFVLLPQLYFVESHRNFTSSQSCHQTHIVKFFFFTLPSIMACNEMFFLFDFYETRNLWPRRMLLQIWKLRLAHTHILYLPSGEDIFHLSYHVHKKNVPSKKLRKHEMKRTWCLNTRFPTVNKTENVTWMPSKQSNEEFSIERKKNIRY